MKLTLFIALLFVAQSTLAAPIFCSGKDWRMTTNSNQSTGKLTFNEEPVEFGGLSCANLRQHGGHYLACISSASVADTGYQVLVALQLPGIEMKGTLSEQTIVGARKLASLKCISAAD